MSAALALHGITKRFGAFTALENVSLTATAGKIHALVGENGAGKTTLMKVAYGMLTPDAGTVTMNGEECHFRSAKEAIAAHIGMVSQHYAIIPELTCLQNLLLGAEPSAIIDLVQAETRAQELASQMGMTFAWHDLAAGLGPARSQQLEILKLLWRKSEVLILDEPTALLPPADSDLLFQRLRALAGEGKAIIVVTHRLGEVMDHADEVTVLRGGRWVGHSQVKDTTARDLASQIVGEEMPEMTLGVRELGPDRLVVEGLTVLGDRKDMAVNGATFTVRAGELLGLAGVDGNGQRELAQALIGVRKAESGTVHMDGEPMTQLSPLQRRDKGLRFIPEDRHHEGVVSGADLVWNALLGHHRRAPYAEKGLINWGAAQSFAEEVANRFSTKRSGLQQALGSLSGGNQQRFVVARTLAGEVKVVLALHPTRGLDIKATEDVYAALRESGAAVLVVSSDLDELLTHCDRMIVMSCGQVTAAPKDRAEIGRLMVEA